MDITLYCIIILNFPMCENGMVVKYACSLWVCTKLSMISITHFQIIQKNKKKNNKYGKY